MPALNCPSLVLVLIEAVAVTTSAAAEGVCNTAASLAHGPTNVAATVQACSVLPINSLIAADARHMSDLTSQLESGHRGPYNVLLG